MYGFWGVECDKQNFFVILENFLPFYPPKNQKKIKILKNKKMKKSFRDIILHKWPKIRIIWYVIVIFHFEPFFALLQSKKIKIKEKKKKTPGGIIILHMCT